METSLDFLSSVLDEIALEGLDGITLPTLWVRLQNRPHFPLALDDNSKSFLWECVAVCKDVELYQLPSPRPVVEVYDRYDFVDVELGIPVDPPNKQGDLYPMAMVEDGNIRGSCLTYRTRIAVTSCVRHGSVLLMSLNQATEKWGDTLVLVASPRLRLLSLIGTEANPITDLPKEQYCLLERIGRSRYHGEVSSGDGGLGSFKAVFREHLHYYAKKLKVKGLIMKQRFCSRNKDGRMISGRLFHLTRFFVQRKTKYDTLMECIWNILKDKPGNKAACKSLREEIGLQHSTFKKIIHRGNGKYFKIFDVPYREVFPDSEPKLCKSGEEKQVKAVQMIKSYGDDDDEDVSDEEGESTLVAHFDPTRVLIDRPLSWQVYRVIEAAGPDGISMAAIQRTLTLPRLDIRQICRHLLKRNEVVTVLYDSGRQRLEKFILKKFATESETYRKVKQQAEKLVQNNATEGPVNGNEVTEGSEGGVSSVHDSTMETSGASEEAAEQATGTSENKAVDKDLLIPGPEGDHENQVPTEVNSVEETHDIGASEAESGNLAKKSVITLDGEPVKIGTGEEREEATKEEVKFQHIQSEVIECKGGKAESLLNPCKNIQDTAGFLPVLTNNANTRAEKHLRSLISHRLLKRANIIVDVLKRVKMTSCFDLIKAIAEEERREGYSHKIDRKSVKRIVDRLCKDQRAKVLKTVLKSSNQVKELVFVCDYSLDPDDNLVKGAIEKAKFRFLNSCGLSDKKTAENSETKKKLPAAGKISKVENRKSRKQKPTEKEVQKQQLSVVYDPMFGKRVCGLQPKFVRAKTLHLFLSYLVYHYSGDLTYEGDDIHVYHDSDSWKRFVPPLPDYKKPGWCIIGDAITRMPLFIFVKIVNLRYEVPHLAEYLHDVTKRYYLLKHLPQELRDGLLVKRRYIFMIYEIITRLCYMGLVSFGPRLQSEKDQVYIYVHRKAIIKDTTVSPPSYLYINSSLQYNTKEYNFNSTVDVENYWIDLESVCLGTNLARYSVAIGETIQLEDSKDKPELKASSENKEFHEVRDGVQPPGDGLGAAGLDSSLFAHLRRNWLYVCIPSRPMVEQAEKSGKEQNRSLLQLLLKTRSEGNEKGFHPETRERLQRLNKRVLCVPQKRYRSSTSAGETTPAKRMKTVKVKKKKIRTVKARTKVAKKSRKPHMDATDIEALRKLQKLRADWTPEEDSFLLLCQVASVFCNPKSRTMVVPFSVVRDLLHERFPHLSTNKTSFACQRRLRHMICKSEETQSNVAMFLGEAREDPELVREFGSIKMPRTNGKEWKSVFSALVDKLTNKFAAAPSDRGDTVSLPETLSLLYDNYKVNCPVMALKQMTQHNEPCSVDDVHGATISQMVMSSLSSADDMLNWSYTLYKIYDRYAEDTLKHVINQLHKSRIIAKKKLYRQQTLKNAPTLPYRFSVTYENTFVTRYPSKLFEEASQFRKSLEVSTVLALVPHEHDIPEGYITAVSSFTVCRKLNISMEIPDQVIIFSPSLSDKQKSVILEAMMPSLSDKESQELEKILKTHTHNDEVEDTCDNRKRKKLKVEDENQTSEKCASDAVCLGSSSSLSSKISDCKESSEEFDRRTASRLALHMLRHQSSQHKDDQAFPSHDYIAINPCSLQYQLSSGFKDSAEMALNPAAVVAEPSDISCCLSPLTHEDIDKVRQAHSAYISETLLTYESCIANLKHGYEKFQDPGITKEGKDIFEAICCKKELGMSLRDLWQMFGDIQIKLDVLNHLSLLQDFRVVIRVGISSFHYVAMMYSMPWLVPYFPVPSPAAAASGGSTEGAESSATGGERPANSSDASAVLEAKGADSLKEIETSPVKKSFFVPRLWRKPDGSINCGTFMQHLKTVLCYIMGSPGVSEEKVCERFSSILQPVQTLELLEVLENIHCIFKYYCKLKGKSSLFSPSKKTIVTKVPSLDGIVHYEPFPDAVFKIASFGDAL